MMDQRCMRPWESSTVHVSRAESRVNCACARQQVPDDVTAGRLEQPPFGNTVSCRSLHFEN